MTRRTSTSTTLRLAFAAACALLIVLSGWLFVRSISFFGRDDLFLGLAAGAIALLSCAAYLRLLFHTSWRHVAWKACAALVAALVLVYLIVQPLVDLALSSFAATRHLAAIGSLAGGVLLGMLCVLLNVVARRPTRRLALVSLLVLLANIVLLVVVEYALLPLRRGQNASEIEMWLLLLYAPALWIADTFALEKLLTYKKTSS